MSFVQEYSQRKLTKDKDLLPALGALAGLFANQSGDKYLAGLFRNNMLLQLTWIIDPKMTFIGQTVDAPDYRAPSFSWASVKSNGIMFECDRGNPYVTRPARIIKCKIEPLTSIEPNGQIKTGFIVLKGRLYPLGNGLDDPRFDLFLSVSKLFAMVLRQCPGAKQEYDQRLQMDPTLRFLYLFELFTWSGETESSRWPYRDRNERFVDRNDPTGTPNRYVACLILASSSHVRTPSGNGPGFVRVGFLRLDQGKKDKVMRGLWGPSEDLILHSIEAFDEVEKVRDEFKQVKVKII